MHAPARSACGGAPRTLRRQRDVDRGADRVPDIARERPGDVGRSSEACEVESGEIELDGLRLDQPWRIGGNGKRRDRHLRLARRVEPAHLVCGPQIDAAERQRAAESEQGTLRFALDRKQQSRIVPFRVLRGAAERRVGEISQLLPHATRGVSAPPAARAFPRSVRNPGRDDRCDRSSSHPRPSGRR